MHGTSVKTRDIRAIADSKRRFETERAGS